MGDLYNRNDICTTKPAECSAEHLPTCYDCVLAWDRSLFKWPFLLRLRRLDVLLFSLCDVIIPTYSTVHPIDVNKKQSQAKHCGRKHTLYKQHKVICAEQVLVF